MQRPTLTPFAEGLQAAFEAGDPAVHSKVVEGTQVGSVRRQIEALARNDLPAFLEEMDPSIEFELFAPAEFPFVRRARGLAEFRAAVEQNFGALEDQKPDILAIVAQGDTVIMLGRERGRLRESGKEYDVHFAYQFMFRDGKVIHVRELVAVS